MIVISILMIGCSDSAKDSGQDSSKTPQPNLSDKTLQPPQAPKL